MYIKILNKIMIAGAASFHYNSQIYKIAHEIKKNNNDICLYFIELWKLRSAYKLLEPKTLLWTFVNLFVDCFKQMRQS